MKLSHYESRRALHWEPVSPETVRCKLCPRHCFLKNGSMGYCGVRGAVDGALHTFNFGLSLTPSEEVIESEAVAHFSPGARILSLGNIGCMMSCIFCQNWDTSQIEHLDESHIRNYSPQALVDLCLEHQIKIISWTYNDPVVWHEFVLETSALARKHGLLILYKSAFYIEAAPVDELIECVDIFSISLKSVSDQFYRQSTGATLAPVLRRIEQVARSGRHLELSYLMIPGLNDGDEDVSKLMDWVLAHVGAEVPLHLVAFHPAYHYTQVERTRQSALVAARDLALAKGLRYVYLGNTQQVGDTVCPGCGALLVSRYGLISAPERIAADGTCIGCETQSPIRAALDGTQPSQTWVERADLKHRLEFLWHSEAQSVHVVRASGSVRPDRVRVRPLGDHAVEERCLPGGLDRFIVSRQSDGDRGVVISWDSDNEYCIAPLLDRAHFPVSVDRLIVEETL
jgi:pyruvate formate lyase activating enzyme